MAAGSPVVALDHVYYWTRGMDAAIAFYTDVLGLELVRRSGNGWAELGAGEARLALHATDASHPPSSGTVVFRVDDLDDAISTLRRRGAVFDAQEAEVPGVGRFATFHDPDGNPLQLIEYR